MSLVLQAEQLSMRAAVLTVPTRRVMVPLMTTPTVLLWLQQMGHILDEVWDVAEWVTAVEEVVHEEISWFDAVPDPNPEDQE